MTNIPSFRIEVDTTRRKMEAFFKLEYYLAMQFNEIREDLHKTVENNYDANIQFISNPDILFEKKYREKIIREGFMSFLSGTLAMEDITSPSMEIDQIEGIFRKFVDNIDISSDLLVIDPYFFASKNPDNDYDLFLRCLSPVPQELKKITIIHNGKIEENALDIFKSKITSIKPDVEVIDRTCSIIHDRFWINTINKKGIVVGTSLNGIGKKVSIVDNLSHSDVNSILEELDQIL
ncbi:MAG: hypothetical protein ABF739_04665 [Acetobacter okinawensis]|uniref:hypothetical protein n=1 Tax=Acetobacter okinawensis TaxID=1076594 RepID=UPI0039E8C73C